MLNFSLTLSMLDFPVLKVNQVGCLYALEFISTSWERQEMELCLLSPLLKFWALVQHYTKSYAFCSDFVTLADLVIPSSTKLLHF